MYRVVELVIRTTQPGQLHVERLAPAAEATTGFQTKASAQILALTTIEVELIAQHQPAAAAFGLVVVAFDFSVELSVLGEDRYQRVFQVVVHRQHLFRALSGTVAQRHAGLEVTGPGVAFGRRESAERDTWASYL